MLAPHTGVFYGHHSEGSKFNQCQSVSESGAASFNGASFMLTLLMKSAMVSMLGLNSV